MSADFDRLPDRRSIFRVGTESNWTTVLPYAFIIVSLVSLVALPLIESAHTKKMRSDIMMLAEPARLRGNAYQISLSAELDQIIAFQVTGQKQYRDHYLQLLAEQRSQIQALGKLARPLGEDVDHSFAAMKLQTQAWHTGVQTGELVAKTLPNEVFLARLYERHPAYEAALNAASALEVAIQSVMENRLQQIRDAENTNMSFTIILTVLALISSLLVAGLGRQMRILAGEAMNQRQEAQREAAEAQKARAAAELEERRTAFLASSGQELAASLDYQQTIDTLARLVVPNLAAFCLIELDDADGQAVRSATRHEDPQIDERLRQMKGHLPGTPPTIKRLLQDRTPRLVTADAEIVEFLGLSRPSGELLILVPLISRGVTMGLLLAAPHQHLPFTEDDLSLFGELARRASLAIDNARLYLDSQKAVQAREEVLAIVSHDLRNPLSAVMLAANLLETSGVQNTEDLEQLNIIGISARRMNRLIADLLDATRLEGGKKLPIEPRPIDVEPLLAEVYELFRSQAEAAEVTLRCAAEPEMPQIQADRHRVIQVLSNLIGNALKFTPPGGSIHVNAQVGGNEIQLSVADTGAGIPREDIDKVFTPYWQSKRAERLGAGLGLAISRGVVEAHGGRIWIESEQGKGTVFHFTLPVSARQSEDSFRLESPARLA